MGKGRGSKNAKISVTYYLNAAKWIKPRQIENELLGNLLKKKRNDTTSVT